MEGSESSTKTSDPKYADPLGNRGNTGGPEARDKMFKELWERVPGITAASEQYTRALQKAADDKGFKQGQDLLQGTMDGRYLKPSSYLRDAVGAQAQSARTGLATSGAQARARAGVAGNMAQTRARLAGEGAAANVAAQNQAIQNQYAKAGMRFGTGNQQAQQGAQASVAAQVARDKAALNAQLVGQQHELGVQQQGARKSLEKDLAAMSTDAYLKNYQAERQIQNMAPSQYAQTVSQPLDYLSRIAPSRQQDLDQVGNFIKKMTSGSYVGGDSTTTQTDSGMSTAMGVGSMAIMGAAAMGG